MPLLESLKLPDILKASAAQAFALAFACAAFLYLAKNGYVPTPEPWVVPLVAFVGIFTGALWVSLSVRDLWRVVDLGAHWKRWRQTRARRKSVEAYIPYMNEDERRIIGYLLERNQKTFDSAIDGGYAAPLLSRGIVIIALRPGQHFEEQHTPMAIPDDVWDILVKHKDSFPQNYQGEAYPWRVHWMAR